MSAVWGSAAVHKRYAERLTSPCGHKCPCGCGQRPTHKGMANGVALTVACELGIRRWVKTGSSCAQRSSR
jgi:hypothetical protein